MTEHIMDNRAIQSTLQILEDMAAPNTRVPAALFWHWSRQTLAVSLRVFLHLCSLAIRRLPCAKREFQSGTYSHGNRAESVGLEVI